jgi:hypothetical protein
MLRVKKGKKLNKDGPLLHCCGLKGGGEERENERAGGERKMIENQSDKRRYGVIEVRRINAETYHLTIGGRLWSEVEWSRSRRAWCVQDAAGHCLTHVEHIVGQDRDPQAAIRLAKRMIVDGRMPAPEDALRQLKAERERAKLGERLDGPLIRDRDLV